MNPARTRRLKVHSPEKAKKVLCEAKEEEYHWLVHEDIAIIAYAMMDPRNRTYRDLERSLEERFEELSKYGGLAKEDYAPKEIAQSIVSHNLHTRRNLDDPFHPLQKMVILLPDGDNGFYTNENEGKRLFPEVTDQKACDNFNAGEAFNYSLLPFLYMTPRALGKHESYFLEFLQHIESRSSYRERILKQKGIGGMSVGGFGAIKLRLKYPHLFQSVSSQSGLLDLLMDTSSINWGSTSVLSSQKLINFTTRFFLRWHRSRVLAPKLWIWSTGHFYTGTGS